MNYVDELLPDLMLQAPDVSDVALRRYLQLGAQDLFKETDLWVQELPPLVLFSNLQRYTLRLPKGTRIARIEWVILEGQELDPLDLEDIAENREIGYHLTNDEPHQFLVTDKTPRGEVRISVKLYPTPATTEVPDWLVHDFRTAMVNAGLMKVYGTPGSPWFDPGLTQMFAAQISAASRSGQRLVNNRKRGKRRTVRYGGL